MNWRRIFGRNGRKLQAERDRQLRETIEQRTRLVEIRLRRAEDQLVLKLQGRVEGHA